MHHDHEHEGCCHSHEEGHAHEHHHEHGCAACGSCNADPKAELKALRENPVIPAEVLEKLRAEEAERAAETAQQETSRRVAEAEKAAQESARRAEQAERQLAAADPEVATFKAWFRAVQDDFARMQETHAQVTDQAKADKLRAAVRALLERERTVWG